MAKAPNKTITKTETSNSTEIEHDDEEVFEVGDFPLSEGLIEEETIKRDARRKIEIYWEKNN